MLLLNIVYDRDDWVRLEFLKSGKKEVRYARMPPYFLAEDYREDEQTSKFVRAVRRVKRFDRLWMEEKILWKVEVGKPSDVPKIRDKFKWYEADIKFTHNVAYDLGLIPGGIYREERGRLVPVFSYPEGLYEAPIPVPKFWAFDIEVLSDRVPDPRKADKPVVSVAISDGEKSEVYLWKWKDEECPKGAKCFETEEEMLEAVIDRLASRPFLVGYNSDLFDIPYLVNRARKLKVFAPFEVKMRGFKAFNGEEFSWWAPINGFHIDLIHFFSNSSIQNYTFGGAYREYSLDSVAEALLGAGKVLSLKERSIEDLGLAELAEYNKVDAELTAKLFSYENFLPWKVLVILARIAKLSLGEVLRTSISSWIASALMYEHRRTGSLIPSKEELAELKGEVRSQSITGKQYKGAIVITPPKGVFFNVAVLDFASLYPTIMIRYNISYETVNPLFPCRKAVEVPEVGHIVCQDVEGIQSEFIKTLRDLRVSKYKKKAKDEGLPEEERRFYDALQMTFKVVINASYGVFGNQGFRFYCPPVAESITAFGRYVLTRTKEYIETEVGRRVLYGDSVSKDTKVIVRGCTHKKCYSGEEVPIEELFVEVHKVSAEGKEYYFPPNLEVLTLDPKTLKAVFKPVKYVMRHKTNKRMFRVWINNMHYIDVTEDHSLMGFLNVLKRRKYGGRIMVEVKPEEIGKVTSSLIMLREWTEEGADSSADFVPVTAKRVEQIDYSDYVYDLEVEDTHTFFANKLLVHNTDSLFIENPAEDEIRRIVEWVKEKFGLDIELDKVYHHVLFTGRKKNYVGVRPDGKVDVKGMVGKKSDVPPFIRRAFERAVEAVASIRTAEDVERVANKVLSILREAEEAIMRGEVEPEELAFSAMLKDKPENYKAKSPHVQASLYLAKRGVPVGPGYVVRYVKGRNGWVPVEFAHKKHLDRQYYKQRLYSAFEQLLDGLGINEKQIAKANLLRWFRS